MTEDHELVIVTWKDANSDDTWGDPLQEPKLTKCVEIGIVWAVTEEVLMLTSGWTSSGAIGTRMNIPTANIEEIRIIKNGSQMRKLEPIPWQPSGAGPRKSKKGRKRAAK